MGRRYPACREAIPASLYTKPKIRLRKGFYVARRRRRPVLGITRTGPLRLMWKNPYMVMGKGLSCVPVVENFGDSYAKAGIVKPLKSNTKIAISPVRDRTPGSITGDGTSVTETAPAGGHDHGDDQGGSPSRPLGSAHPPLPRHPCAGGRGWSAGMRMKADCAATVAMAPITPSTSPREPTGASRNRPSTSNAERRLAPQGETTRSLRHEKPAAAGRIPPPLRSAPSTPG